TIRDGQRASAAVGYLKPAMRRGNLKVEVETLVERVLLEDGRAVGVAYRVGGQPREARARGEVILSAGSINSPQILELSGVGQPELLQSLGVEVRHPLAGVGENLRDHIAPRLKWRVTKPGVTYNDRAAGWRIGWQVLRYAVNRSGFLSLPSAPMLTFFRTRDELESPDIQLHIVPYYFSDPNARRLYKEPGMIVTVYQCRPESTGSIHSKSADPAEPPAIRFNFLSEELDRRCLLDGVHLSRKIIESPAMDGFRGVELAPGEEVQGDEAVLAWVRETAETTFHPTGTCRMGQDDRAVVDERLRVRGVTGLRVADGSIMPTLVSGNTNAACLMIGEKAAAMVLEDAA
ncbi:MAG: GMC oxidoreductase, partial [Alphaproteobacteria bacterium]|nr:GMC oxidoreductase [Alphaproteobacteria bacterium]